MRNHEISWIQDSVPELFHQLSVLWFTFDVYRGNFHFQDVSGFAVSAVSAVILPDINEMELTASDVCAVSGAVSAVSLPMDSGNLRENMKSR